MKDLIEILIRSVYELEKGVTLLRDFKKSDEIQKVLEKVNEYENQADAIFEKAIADSKSLPEKPSNETLLNLYSLYKQSTEGDVNIEPPAMFDFVAKAKY